jgi:hypothetical protein
MLTNPASAQTSAFNYQGKLANNGSPANGQYDFTFTLWDQPTGGTQVASMSLQNTAVTEGIFTVTLDFGLDSFNGGGTRFLEIGVKPSADPSALPTVLAPRQQIQSTPYAIKSIYATTANLLSTSCVECVQNSQIEAVSADKILTGILSINRGGTGLSSTGDAGNYLRSDGGNWVSAPIQTSDLPDLGIGYVKNSLAQQASANFNISGNGTAGGTLSGNIVNATTQFNLNTKRILAAAGTNSFFAGINAGTTNTGNYNSFVGANAGMLNTASFNSFFGSNAGQSNTTGALNAFFGSDAGLFNVNGGNNSFFGYRAGRGNTSGNNNSFFGSSAGLNNNTGFNNSFYGKDSGITTTSGHDNSIFGYTAGYANNGNSNSFFGSRAGVTNTSGTDNSFFGENAGRDNSVGNSNAFLGGSAGLNNESGSANTFIGVSAGDSNVSGSNLTAVGAAADVLNNVTNATAIGYRAAVSQSNSLVLGSINGVNGSNVDTKIGIGTTAPTERLTIQTPNAKYGWIHTNGDVVVGSFVGGSDSTNFQRYGGWIGTKTNHPLSFFTNSAEAALLIDTSGYLHVRNLPAGNLQLCLDVNSRMSYCSSSLRYKANVQSFVGGLEILNRLRPISFTWKNGGMRDLGFGAEEVAKVEPLLTFRNSKNEVEGVKYNQISVVLVNAVKEQQAQIVSQAAQIKRLQATRAENRELKSQLNALLSRVERLERRSRRRK